MVKPKKRVVYKGNGVTVTATGLTMDEFGDALLMFNIKNNSGDNVYVRAREVSINGYMVTDGYIGKVAPKRKANEELTVYSRYLKKNKIKNIKTAGYTIELYGDDYQTIDESNRIKVKF